MAGNTITAADAVYTLVIDDLYPSGVVLHGFSADNVYSTNDLQLAETVLGVDGYLSAGFVFNSVQQTISIMPDSESWDVFETWQNTSVAAVAVFRCSATVTLPAIKKKYVHINGVLRTWKALPDAAKTLQPGQATIEWQKIVGEVYGV